MAQNITLLGASYSDVPSVELPKTGGGTAQFDDTTIASNAASASDITSGKLAFVNGELVTGTASGGGSLKIGVLRPDAVLDTSWTYDKMIHADEGVTIPSYSTSSTTLKSAATLVSDKQLDNTQYDYIITARGLAIPTYSSSAKGKGRVEYAVYSYAYEINCLPPSTVEIGGVSSGSYGSSVSVYNASNALVYWFSGSTLQTQSGSYGPYLTGTIVSSSSSSTTGAPKITINSPSMAIRGNNTFFTSTYWNYVTDIRYQYIIELWKVPRTNDVDGFMITSQFVHAAKCAQSASGTLT